MTNETPQYTFHVGEKFYADGSVRPYPGNTIISFIDPDSDVFRAAEWLQDQLRTQPYFHKFSLLPPSSFHMTVLGLLVDAIRQPELWSRHLPTDAPLAETDTFFEQHVPTMPTPDGFSMTLDYLPTHTGLSIYIKPADDANHKALWGYREQAAEVTGVRRSDFDTYDFHISLAYRLQVLDDAEQAAFEQFLTEMTEPMREKLGTFRVEKPQLTFFDDMFRFMTVDEKSDLQTR